MKIQFLRCNADHLEALITIARKTYQQHYQYLWHDNGEAYMLAEFNRDTIKRQLSDALAEFYLISYQHETIGYLKLLNHSGPSGYASNDCIEIQRVYLLAEYAGKQLGSSIFNKIEQVARGKNISVLWLQVMDNSKAKTFYLKHGYQVIHKMLLDRPHIKEEFRDMEMMTKQI